MSKTAAYVRYAVVPSFPRLPLEHPGLSIANKCPFSRDFFNSIDPLLTLSRAGSGHRNRQKLSSSSRVPTATRPRERPMRAIVVAGSLSGQLVAGAAIGGLL